MYLLSIDKNQWTYSCSVGMFNKQGYRWQSINELNSINILLFNGLRHTFEFLSGRDVRLTGVLLYLLINRKRIEVEKIDRRRKKVGFF